MAEKIQVSISGVLADLKAGLKRDAIQTKYGLTKGELVSIFKHPKLKGKKTHKDKAERIELVDDTASVDLSTISSATLSSSSEDITVTQVQERVDLVDDTDDDIEDEEVKAKPAKASKADLSAEKSSITEVKTEDDEEIVDKNGW